MGYTGAGQMPPTGDLLGAISDDLKVMDNVDTPITATTNYTQDLGLGFGGSPARPTQIVADIDSLDSTTGDETYTWALQQSIDNFSSDTETLIAAEAMAVGFQSKVVSLTKRYFRIVVTLGGTTPILSGRAWIVPISGG